MLSKRLIVIYFVIGVTSKFIVEGLQCYVCEDCNEYEDFKELHICGEIATATTMLPMTLPALLANTTDKTTAKPVVEDTEEYIYDSLETHDDTSNQSSDKKKEESNSSSNGSSSSASSSNTSSSGSASQSNSEENKLPSKTETTTKANTTTTATKTTRKPAEASTSTNKTTGSQELSSSESPLIPSAPTPPSTSSSSNPIKLPDDYDYMEYDIMGSGEQRQVKPHSISARSTLLKINEPVCYMIKYQVNNTVVTNRGCTTFINANKDLTCQSLYNGAPMEKCVVCSKDGCNKLLSDDTSEDDDDIFFNTAIATEKLGIFVVLMMVVTNLILV